MRCAKLRTFCGAGMHRSEAEGRFGAAEPAGRSSVCARALLIGVKFGELDWVRIGSGSKMGKLQAANGTTQSAAIWYNREKMVTRRDQ